MSDPFQTPEADLPEPTVNYGDTDLPTVSDPYGDSFPVAPPAQPAGSAYVSPPAYNPNYGPMPSYGPHASSHYGGHQPGYQYPGQPVGHVPTDGFAIASLISGIAGLFVVPIIGSLLGIIFGIIAISRIRSSGFRGRGVAIAGIVTGAISLVLGIVGIVMLVHYLNTNVLPYSIYW